MGALGTQRCRPPGGPSPVHSSERPPSSPVTAVARPMTMRARSGALGRPAHFEAPLIASRDSAAVRRAVRRSHLASSPADRSDRTPRSRRTGRSPPPTSFEATGRTRRPPCRVGPAATSAPNPSIPISTHDHPQVTPGSSPYAPAASPHPPPTARSVPSRPSPAHLQLVPEPGSDPRPSTTPDQTEPLQLVPEPQPNPRPLTIDRARPDQTGPRQTEPGPTDAGPTDRLQPGDRSVVPLGPTGAGQPSPIYPHLWVYMGIVRVFVGC